MMLHDAKCQLESQASIIRQKESEIESLRSMPQTAVSHQSSKKVEFNYVHRLKLKQCRSCVLWKIQCVERLIQHEVLKTVI